MSEILRDGSINASFVELSRLIVANYKTEIAEQADHIMDELLAVKILPDETENAYLPRGNRYIAQLDSAKNSYSLNSIGTVIN